MTSDEGRSLGFPRRYGVSLAKIELGVSVLQFFTLNLQKLVLFFDKSMSSKLTAYLERIVITKTTVSIQRIAIEEEHEAAALPPPEIYIRMKGEVGYNINFDTVSIQVEEIEHNCEATGSIKLVLWAMESYGGGDWEGTRMGEVCIESCEQGYSYANIDQTVPRTSPDPGTYTMIVALEAYMDGEYVTYDHRVFDEKCVISRQVKFQGDVGYNFSGSSVELRADMICHNYSNSTGSLKLVLWASPNPVVNGRWANSYIIASIQLEALFNGHVYQNFSQTVSDYVYPPNGSYFIIMELESFEGTVWCSSDYRQFDEILDFLRY